MSLKFGIRFHKNATVCSRYKAFATHQMRLLNSLLCNLSHLRARVLLTKINISLCLVKYGAVYSIYLLFEKGFYNKRAWSQSRDGSCAETREM